MRRDFRVKVDFSQIYQDARQQSWVFVDGSRIYQVRQLAIHIQQLFNIEESFYLLAYHEDDLCYLPFDEDVRVLENNDVVRVMPGSGEVEDKGEVPSKKQHEFVEPKTVRKSKDALYSAEEKLTSEETICTNSQYSDSFVTQNNGDVSRDLASVNGTLYKTALLDLENEAKVNDEENSMDTTAENPSVTNKRKRVRKRKTKKSATTAPIESDTSLIEASGKKPKIVENVLLSTGKHIRFQGVDNEESTSDDNSSEQNTTKENETQHVKENGKLHNRLSTNNEKLDLSNLLTFRQSSTPLTFAYKKSKKDDKFKKINESDMIVEVSGSTNGSYLNSSINKSNTIKKENVNNSVIKENDTIVFKKFKIGEDYTPQPSQMIVAKVLHSNDQSFTLDIIHNKEELKDPEGKFSLPIDDDAKEEENNIFTINKSEIIELRKL